MMCIHGFLRWRPTPIRNRRLLHLILNPFEAAMNLSIGPTRVSWVGRGLRFARILGREDAGKLVDLISQHHKRELGACSSGQPHDRTEEIGGTYLAP